MSNKQYQGRYFSCLLLSTVILLSGCNNKTAEELVSQAQTHYTQGNKAVAEIELKNILQTNPQDESALLLLSKIYIENHETEEVISLLSAPVSEGVLSQKLLFSYTDALIQFAQFDRALKTINKNKQRFETAQGLALKAHCLAGLNKIAEARDLYHKSLAMDENLVSSHLGLAQEYIISAETVRKNTEQVNENGLSESDQHLSKAKTHLKKVLFIDSDNIIANYLFATINYFEKNITDAQTSINKVLDINPEHKESLLLMGKLHLELAHLDKSQEFLKKYITIVPQDVKARMYLASIMLRKKQPDLAFKLLENFSEKGSHDTEYLLILGNIYLAKGEHGFAVASFEKAHVLLPDSTLVKMYLSMGYLARGGEHPNDHDAAINLLTEVLEVDPENTQAGISLITTLLQKGEYEKVINVTNKIKKRSPKLPMPWYLSGLAYQSMGSINDAIAAFSRTLKLNHSFIPATVRLAKIYQSEGDNDLARKQYEAALYDSPYNPEVMTELAILEEKLGNIDKSLELLELARDRNKKSLTPRLMLGTYYLRKGQLNTSQEIVDELNKIAPERPDVQMYFGRVQLAVGRSSEAVSIFAKLVELEPTSSEILTKYGSALRLNGQNNESRKALSSALGLSKQRLPETLIEMGYLELAENKKNELKSIVNELQSNFPEKPSGYLLEADFYINQKNYSDAAVAYEKAYELNGNTSTVLKLYDAYKLSGQVSKADLLLAKETENSTDNLRLRITLATQQHRAGNQLEAIKIYLSLLELYPENSLILNNLAWVYDESNPKKALSLAERAYNITPEIPQIIDSYGWFCLLDGRTKEGLYLIEKAVEKSPAEPEFRYHLAKALFITGKKQSARESLELALATQAEFNGRTAAEDLLVKLIRDE